jgi:hypothetical protein
MNKKIVLLLMIFSLLIGSVIGIIFEKSFSRYQSNLIENQKEENKEEVNCGESQDDTVLSPLSGEAYQVDGSIVQTGNSFLIVEALIQSSRLPLLEEEITEKQNIKIYISEETEIFLIEPTDSVVPEHLSGSFEKLTITFEDLQLNDHVLVKSKENVKNKEEFIADEIQVIRDFNVITPEDLK